MEPLDPRKDSATPGERAIDKPELPTQGYAFTMSADTETIEGKGQLKLGTHRHFEVYCDEPPRIVERIPTPSPFATLPWGWDSDFSPSLRGTRI